MHSLELEAILYVVVLQEWPPLFLAEMEGVLVETSKWPQAIQFSTIQEARHVAAGIVGAAAMMLTAPAELLMVVLAYGGQN